MYIIFIYFHFFHINSPHVLCRYREASVSPALWLKESLNTFREAVLNLSQPNRPSTHAPLERTAPPSPVALNVNALQAQSMAHAGIVGGGTSTANSGANTPNRPSSSSSGGGAGGGGSGNASAFASQVTQAQQQKATLDNLARLMSACVVLRIEDFTLYRVTTSGRKQMPKEFVSGINLSETPQLRRLYFIVSYISTSHLIYILIENHIDELSNICFSRYSAYFSSLLHTLIGFIIQNFRTKYINFVYLAQNKRKSRSGTKSKFNNMFVELLCKSRGYIDVASIKFV